MDELGGVRQSALIIGVEFGTVTQSGNFVMETTTDIVSIGFTSQYIHVVVGGC